MLPAMVVPPLALPTSAVEKLADSAYAVSDDLTGLYDAPPLKLRARSSAPS